MILCSQFLQIIVHRKWIAGLVNRCFSLQRGANVENVDDFAAVLALPYAYSLFLRREPIRSTTAQGRQALSFMAWRIPTQGGRVIGGSIKLPATGILLLLGCGVRFHQTAFSGMHILQHVTLELLAMIIVLILTLAVHLVLVHPLCSLWPRAAA